MPKLVISQDRVVKQEYPIEKVRIVIGRGKNNDIQLNDAAASGKHAEIVTVGNDAFVHDLGSTNGTYVNNLLTKRCALNNGDLIGIGNHVVAFHTEQATDTVPDFEKTMVIQTGLRQHAGELQSEMTAIAKAEEKEKDVGVVEAGSNKAAGYLEVLSGALKGKRLQLNRAIVSLGRPGIQAAVVSRRASGYFLTHVAGAGGTKTYPLVNGQSTGPRAHALNDKDVIELAGIEMVFRA